MAERYQRNLFVHVNKYQRIIIFSVMFPSILSLLIALASLYYIRYVAGHLVFFSNIDINHTDMFIPWFMDMQRSLAMCSWVLLGVGLILLGIIVWSFKVSNQLVGPYERVVKELDEVLTGKNKKPIVLRNKDEMFSDLVKRINELISRLPDNV